MISREQIEKREDELAKQEYRRKYTDLPGDIKQNVHNAALEQLGLRRKFQFTCLDCKRLYEDMVEGNLVEIYTDIQSEAHIEVLESVCPPCQEIRDRKAYEEEWS